MRKGIHSLYSLIKEHSSYDALNGDVYIFISSSRKSIKILRWQHNGFLLYHHKLEISLFTIPRNLVLNDFTSISFYDLNKLITDVHYRSVSNELSARAMINN